MSDPHSESLMMALSGLRPFENRGYNASSGENDGMDFITQPRTTTPLR